MYTLFIRFWKKYLLIWLFQKYKAWCAFPMVISSDFRIGHHRDDDHQADAPHFTPFYLISCVSEIFVAPGIRWLSFKLSLFK